MPCFRRTMRGHHYLLSQKFSRAVRISLEEAWVYRTTKNHLHLVLFFKILARQRQILVPFLRYEDHHQKHGKTRAWNPMSGNTEMSAWEYTAKSFQPRNLIITFSMEQPMGAGLAGKLPTSIQDVRHPHPNQMDNNKRVKMIQQQAMQKSRWLTVQI